MLKSTANIITKCRASKQNVFQIRSASQTIPDLSSEKYKVKRHNFEAVELKDLDFFQSLLGQERVHTDESDVLPYNIDWPKTCRGQSSVVLKPKTTDEVSRILAHCNKRRLAVCPQGGNTGIVGAGVPVFDEIILNLGLMNRIIGCDQISGALTCEAGCILQNLESYLHERGLIMPLDLGAKGTCQIGGNISTNAGGQRLMRYGNLHGSILGLEIVKADGTVVDCLRTLRKDNTGYHLKHLFVGAEGTLGVITKVAIHCPVLPKAVTVGFFGVESFEAVLNVFQSAKSSLGEILSAFEMMDHETVKTTVRNMKLRLPISDFPFYVLLETHGSDVGHDSEKMTMFLTKQMANGVIKDGTVTSDQGKVEAIWNVRESVAPAGLLDGYMFTYDVSLPLARYYDLIPTLRQRLANKVTSVHGFGHIGDGNLHINVTLPEYSEDVLNLLEPFVFEEVSKLKGSISAEHGIGFRKPQFMYYSNDVNAINLMKEIKQLMDPNGILNPYKVLPNLNL